MIRRIIAVLAVAGAMVAGVGSPAMAAPTTAAEAVVSGCGFADFPQEAYLVAAEFAWEGYTIYNVWRTPTMYVANNASCSDINVSNIKMFYVSSGFPAYPQNIMVRYRTSSGVWRYDSKGFVTVPHGSSALTVVGEDYLAGTPFQLYVAISGTPSNPGFTWPTSAGRVVT